MGFAYSLDPIDTSHSIIGQFAQLDNLPRAGVPHVHAVTQTNTKQVATSPIHEIKVEIIGKLGRIKHFVWHFANRTWLFARTEE